MSIILSLYEVPLYVAYIGAKCPGTPGTVPLCSPVSCPEIAICLKCPGLLPKKAKALEAIQIPLF